MSIVLSDSMRSSHSSVDAYGSTKTSEKTNVMDLKAVYGVCHYRDRYVETGSGTVTNADARFTLHIEGASDEAHLISRERGTYVAGFVSECGLGLDVDPSGLVGSQTLDFGNFDDANGYFFRLSAGGVLSLHVRKKGVTVDIPQSQWNGDHGPHSIIDYSRGLVWLIQFTYYGYGSILFSIVSSDSRGAQINRMLHSYGSPDGLTCCNPNLPIAVRLNANGTAGSFDAHVGGRQFSIQGQFHPKFRVTQTEERIEGLTYSTAMKHVVSYMKNDSHAMCAMKVIQMDVVSTGPLLLYFLIDTQLTGATYAGSMVPPDCIPGVSGLSRDVAATSMTGGLLLYTKLVGAGYTYVEIPTSVNIDDRNMTVACRTPVPGGDPVDASLVVRIKEYF